MAGKMNTYEISTKRKHSPDFLDVHIRGRQPAKGFAWVDLSPDGTVARYYALSSQFAQSSKYEKIALLFDILDDLGISVKGNDERISVPVPRSGPIRDKMLALEAEALAFYGAEPSEEEPKQIRKRKRETQADKDLKKALRAQMAIEEPWCQHCGFDPPVREYGTYPAIEYLEYDHVDPDGPTTLENGQLLCRECNGDKNRHKKGRAAARNYWRNGRRGGLVNEEIAIADPEERKAAMWKLINAKIKFRRDYRISNL